jgi:hypothetical protein
MSSGRREGVMEPVENGWLGEGGVQDCMCEEQVSGCGPENVDIGRGHKVTTNNCFMVGRKVVLQQETDS